MFYVSTLGLLKLFFTEKFRGNEGTTNSTLDPKKSSILPYCNILRFHMITQKNRQITQSGKMENVTFTKVLPKMRESKFFVISSVNSLRLLFQLEQKLREIK